MQHVAQFLDRVAAWAAGQRTVRAVGLAGSWARGTATPESDVDLVILVDDTSAWLADSGWMQQFGEVTRQDDEDWGMVQSRRALFRDGLEVEFGITTAQWAALPVDAGTSRVIRHGFAILYDPEGVLGRALSAVTAAAADAQPEEG